MANVTGKKQTTDTTPTEGTVPDTTPPDKTPTDTTPPDKTPTDTTPPDTASADATPPEKVSVDKTPAGRASTDPAAGGTPAAKGGDAPPARRRARSAPELAGLLVVLVALIAFFWLKSPYFMTKDNIVNVLTAIAVTGIIAIPGTMLLVAGQVDLSVGSGAAFCGVMMATVSQNHALILGVLVAVGLGILIGLVNGLLVTVLRVNALIATLGMLAVLRGLTEVRAHGATVTLANFSGLGTARPFLNIPVPGLLLLGIAVLAALVMRYTVFGRSLYAAGSNPVAARLVGVRGGKMIVVAFVLSGVGVALSGLILDSQLSAASPNAATGLELSVVTAIVLGGASLAGGRGTIQGTIVGLLIIGVLNNGLTLLNVSSFYQQVASGALLIIAVSFDQLRLRFSKL
ncbi:ABC transporter permease [Actinacidiphila alni]|uniref:ABC transporter permease n=1 Tax=Actinacidiphila alni TaxID=380248 RepID=UPI0033DAED8D